MDAPFRSKVLMVLPSSGGYAEGARSLSSGPGMIPAMRVNRGPQETSARADPTALRGPRELDLDGTV